MIQNNSEKGKSTKVKWLSYGTYWRGEVVFRNSEIMDREVHILGQHLYNKNWANFNGEDTNSPSIQD